MTTATAEGLAVREATDDDWPAIADLRDLAFRFRGTRERLLPGMWLVTERAVVVGCGRLQVAAQWFGGRALPTGMVSSVAVAPEARGRGVSRALIRALLEQARAAGCVGVSLYPSALQPYRRAGFAVAGTHLTARLRFGSIVPAGPATVERFDGDLAGLMSQYSHWAATTEGGLERSEEWWRERVLSSDPPTPHDADDGAPHAYVVRDRDGIVAHVVYSQRAQAGANYLAELACRSLAWETPEAGRALLGFLASGQPLTTAMTWAASAVDPVGAFVDAQPQIVSSLPWMHRLVDPAAAIGGRTYPELTRTGLEIRVEDPFIPDWSVTLSIAIEDGAARVEATQATSARAAPIRVDVLGAILAGGLHPLDAARLGWLPDEPPILGGLIALAPSRRRWIGDTF
ncbi:MAG TPA: GNAT family N-acetyltransferase [Candidatus Limnocylindria bacterium]|nr:GNAT family N-acetyltransferase [Candidatus Limnocylindria bacterium]